MIYDQESYPGNRRRRLLALVFVWRLLCGQEVKIAVKGIGNALEANFLAKDICLLLLIGFWIMVTIHKRGD